jgi:hypothetical protein
MGLGLDGSDTFKLTGTLDNRGTTLAVGGTNGAWTLAGGRIYQGTVTTAPGSVLATSGGTLDGVQLNGILNQMGGATLFIFNNLTLNGEIDVGGSSGAYLNFGLFGGTTGQSITGTGKIVFGGGYNQLANGASSPLTIGSGITIEGGTGFNSIQGPIDNHGTIDESAAGGSLLIGNLYDNSLHWTNDGIIRVSNNASVVLAGVAWVNNGAIQASGGKQLSLYGNWTNSASGSIAITATTTAELGAPGVNVDPTNYYPFIFSYPWTNLGSINIGPVSTVNLGGVFTASTLATLGLVASDTVNLTGTLDNRGATLAVGGANPSWNLAGGRIYQGTVITAPGSALMSTTYNYSSSSTLDGVQINGTLDITPNTVVVVLNGLTLYGVINLGGTSGAYASTALFFEDSFTNPAAPSLSGTGQVVFGNDYYGDDLANFSSYTLTIGSGITLEGGQMSSVTGPINNLGTIEENTAGGFLQVSYPNFNQLANYDATTETLTGGTWEASNGGNLQLNGAPITTNAATIILTGAGSHLTTDGTTDALAGLTTNAAGGSLTVQGGASVSSSQAVTNLGTLVVGPGGSFSAAGGYTQSSGLTVVDGTLSAPNVALNGGVLKGSGNVQGNVVNAAEIDPGDPLGTLGVTGNYTQTAAGVLNVEIGGTAAGAFDQLAVSGVATPGGTLNVLYVNGFIANPGNTFPILTFGSRSGSSDFATENGLNPVSGQFLIPTYHGGDLTLTAKDSSKATLTSSASPSMFGQAVTFTATVNSNGPGVGAPTGYVDFYDTTTQNDLGLVALSGGKAQLTTTTLPVGSQTITLNYQGDGGFLTSSTNLTLSVIESTWILDATASGALSVSGKASLNVAGVIEVDSKSATAIQASGNATVKASSIQEVGGYSISGKATLNPTPTKGITAFSDPLASVTAPTVTNNQGSVTLSGNQSKTIDPGIYSQIKVSGNAKLTMNPGIYVIAGGGFSVTGNGSVSGSGVMIYNAGSNYNGGSGNTFGGITLSGNGTINLTAPTTGPFAGIVLFQSRDNLKAMSLSGNDTAGLSNGIVYAPGALLTISGNAIIQHVPFVVDELQLSDNG